jgi:hypothetical protein
MKPLFIIMMIVSSLFVKNIYAADIISGKALHAFKTTFTSATEVSWTTAGTYYRVQFWLNKQLLTAFYDGEGELIGVTRNISSLQLPIMLQTELKKKFPDHWITGLLETWGANGIHYFLTMENADTKTILKSSGNTTWSVYQKICKS